MNILDTRDAEILTARIAARATIDGARVGDFVRMPDGNLLRFTHDWGDGLQTTLRSDAGSFYFCKSGHMDYSGGLDRALPRDRLRDTGDLVPATAWFFHHDHHRAHNSVAVVVLCRLFEYQP
jgi:hypothetical protein